MTITVDHSEPRLGLRENFGQFGLLVVVNVFVGAMAGMERSILPAIATDEFHLAAQAEVLSFIVVFGVVKALTNYVTGRLSESLGRKTILVRAEVRQRTGLEVTQTMSQRETFKATSLTNRSLSAISQAGLVNNLNDGMAWGLFPLVYAGALIAGLGADRLGLQPPVQFIAALTSASGLVVAFRMQESHAQ
jgi:MFS family permease